LRGKDLRKWSVGYLRYLLSAGRHPKVDGTTHILFAFCDHFEPLWGGATKQQAIERVARWESLYPEVTSAYRDADGFGPRHTFFFPGEQYHPDYIESLARLVSQGHGEVELHVHHDGDTGDSLRAMILRYLDELAGHGHLTRDGNGRKRYAFIHGDWALANSRNGRHCGVDNELEVLWDTGCYADFTFPSVPNQGQPPIVNQIYWPVGDLSRRCAHDQGSRARVGEWLDDRILMIQGPSGPSRRPGLIARLENGDIQGHDGADPIRIRSWVKQHVHVAGRPEWLFVKVHTHGAPEKNAINLLSGGARTLHEELNANYNDGSRYALHYVSAREMYNIAAAAMDGKSGDPGAYRDYRLAPPPLMTQSLENSASNVAQ
jgi:hypothetical protein